MNTAGSAIAVVLAIIFAVSGVGKLSRLEQFKLALIGTYGIPPSIAGPLKVMLPAYEITASVLLLPGETRIVGLAISGVFFAAAFFIAAAAFLAGRTGDCGCFGELVERRLGRGTLARLAILLGLDALAAILVLPTIGGHLLLPGALDLLLAIAGACVAAMALLAAGRAARAMAMKRE